MKKLTALLLALVMLLSLTACGSTQEPAGTQAAEGTQPATEAATEATLPVEVDEGLIFVDITMPASLFTEMAPEEIVSAAEEAGFSNCKVNEDGSVTYTMTKAKQKQMLEDYKNSIQEMINGYLEGENKVASFVDIVCNDIFSQIDVFVDAQQYTTWDSMYALAFYMTGIYYQAFAGMDADEVDVVVNFIDSQTQQILDSASYRDFMSAE